jgi:hypothetical protein
MHKHVCQHNPTPTLGCIAAATSVSLAPVFWPEGGAVLLYLQMLWYSSWTQGRRSLTATCTARTAGESGCTGLDKAGQQLPTASTAQLVKYGEQHMQAPAGWASAASWPGSRTAAFSAWHCKRTWPGRASTHAERKYFPWGPAILAPAFAQVGMLVGGVSGFLGTARMN